MGQATGTYSTYDNVGNREDLIDKIFDISPTDVPIQNAIGKSKAKATYHTWQTDSLAAADADNAAIEGDEYSYSEPSPTVLVGNYSQIFRKTVKVSGTQEAVDKAGRNSELGYQVAKRNKEIKRDVEASITSHNASVAGNDTTARKSAGFCSWITTNDSRGATGADGGFSSGIVAAPTNGTQRTFTKTLLDGLTKLCVDSGSELKLLSVGTHNKQVFSGFMSDSNVAQLRKTVPGKTQAQIVAAAEAYISDFGNLVVKYNRFQSSRDALMIDPDYASIAVLRKPHIDKPSKTGDATNWVLLHECTLRIDNEAAHGIIADLETS